MNFDITQSFHNVLDTIISWLPTVLLVILTLAIGWLVAILLRSATRRLLDLVGLNRNLSRSEFGEQVNSALGGASTFFGKVVYVLVWLGTLGVAASQLNLEPVTNLVNAIYSYIPNILAALVIFVLAALVSGFAKKVINKILLDTPTGKVVGAVVPVVVMSIAGFMILNELQLAPQIINITYGALMGALALGLALSFGLGGREVAAKMLSDAYKNGQKHVEQAKKDVASAKKSKK